MQPTTDFTLQPDFSVIDDSLRDTFALTSAFAVFVDAQNLIVLHSAAIQSLLAESAMLPRLVGHSFATLLHPHDHHQVLAVLRAARRQPGTTITYHLRTRDGDRLLWRIRARESGHVLIFADRDSTMTYVDLVQTLRQLDGLTVLVYDAEQQVVHGGGALFDTTGLALADIGNASIATVLRSIGLLGLQDTLSAALHGRATFIDHYQHANRIFNIHAVPLALGNPTIPQAAIVIYDVSRHYGSLNQRLERARRFERLVEHQSKLVLVFRPDWYVVFANEALCDYYGINRRELENHRISPSSLPSVALKTFEHKAAQATPKAPYFTLEFQSTVPNGQERWQAWGVQAIFYPYSTQVMEYHAIGSDITSRKAAEYQQLLSEQRLQLAVDGAQLGMWDWDIVHNTVVYGAGWARMLGYTDDEFAAIPSPWETLVHPEDHEQVYQGMWAHLLGRSAAFHSIHRLRGKNSGYLWVTMSGRVMKRDSDGRPLRAAGILMNIHKQHVATDALQTQHHRLRTLVDLTSATGISLDVHIRALLQSATELMQLEAGVLTQIEGDTLTYRHVYAPTRPDLQPGLSFPIANTFCRDTIQQQSVHSIQNAETENHACYETLGLRAYIGVPLFVEGKLYGTLALLDENPRDTGFSNNDADYMHLMGRWISTTLERQSMYDTLAQQEALYRDMVTRATDIVYRTNRAGYFEFVNPVGLRLTGYAAKELKRMTYHAIIPPEDVERVETFFLNVAKRRIDRSYIEFPILTKSGDVHWLGNNIQVMTVDGHFAGFQGIARDITLQHNAEIEREQLIHELDAFAETVAHDLKNPVHTILGYAALAKENKTLDDETRMMIDRIHRVGAQMNTIIIELLKLAELRNNSIEFEALDMQQIIQNTLVRLDFLIQQKAATIIVAEQFPDAYGYTPWIEEVFANYVSNALRYGGESPTIEIGGGLRNGEFVRFYVKDDGPGVPPQHHHKLFKPRLLQGDHEDSSGIGLSIVERIIHRHGGQVGVESDGQQGATFYFDLPR